MRRTAIFIAASALALVAAAAAIAVTGDSGLTTTTATFAAAKDKATSRTCTGPDGDYTITQGRYVGKIDFAEAANSDLDGDIVIRARTVQKTGGAGYLEGSFRIGGDGHHGAGRIVATLDGTKLDGFVSGVIGGRRAILIGDVSAAFTADSGFAADSRIGNGDTSLPAVLAAHPCRPANPDKPAKPEPKRLELFKGAVVGTPTTSITVHTEKNGDKTCTIKDGKPSVDGIVADTKVAVLCLHDGDALTLVKVVKTDKPNGPGGHKKFASFRGTTVGAPSATSITVHTKNGDKTCTINDNKPSTSDVPDGTAVAVLCVYGDGDSLTLVGLWKLPLHPAAKPA
jgi:hypothetical protein